MSLVAGADAQNPRRFVPGELIVKLSPSASTTDALALRASLGATVTRRYNSIDAELWHISGIGVEDAVKRFQGDRRVVYVEPNFIVRAHALIPNDTRFSDLWGMNNTGQQGGTPDADIDAPEAWSVSTGGPILVGVIDTGVDMNHPDLIGHIYSNPGEIAGNGVDDDHNGFIDDVHGWDFANGDNNPTDDNGHGTHVSGTIGATGNNATGVAGVCWSATIVPLKFLDASGFGSTDAAIQAVQYATLMGVRLTNNSWGGAPYSAALRDAIQEAADHGILFVASSGNDGMNSDVFPTYPAGYNVDNIIAVGSTDRHDLLSSFSNFGVTSVDLCAPGSEILSTLPGNQYAVASGTSMAAPHVSGALALVWSVAPGLTRATMKEALLASVDPVPSLAGVVATGGRLNVHAFIASLDAVAPGAVADLAAGEPGSTTVPLAWSATGDDSVTGTASQYDLRFSTSPIDSSNFAGATPAAGAPAPKAAGQPESFEVSGLAYNTTYYFALVVVDDRGNRSPLSNVVTATTLGPPHLVVAPPSLAASQHRGGSETRTLVLGNDAQGTLDYVANGPGWIRVAPVSGRIAAGDTLRVDVTFDATNLAAGEHDSTLTFSTNAPGPQSVVIPVSLHVTDAADVAVAPAALEFGDHYTGTCADDTVIVTNIGSVPLEVSAVTTSLPAFTEDAGPFTLAPGETRVVRVTFCPLAAVEHADTLVIASNDPDHPVLAVALRGRGVDPPVVGVAPSSFSENLYTGGTVQRVLSVSNAGGSDLDFEVRVEPGDSVAMKVDVVGGVAPRAVLAAGHPLSAAQLDRLKASFPRRVTVPATAEIDRGKTPRRHETSTSLPRLMTPDLVEVFGGTENQFFGSVRTRGNIFACDTDTRLLEHRFYLELVDPTQLWFLVYEGLQQGGQYDLVSASDVSPTGPGTGWYSSGDIDVPLRAGRYYLVVASFAESAGYFNDAAIAPYPVEASFGALIAGAGWTWSPETIFPPAPLQWVTPDAFGEPAAYYQALVTRGAVRWCSVTPTTGTVPPDADVNLQVQIDAAGLTGGDYAASLRVLCNDPQAPAVTVPVNMHVTGAPDIALSKTTIDFGTRFLGAVTFDTLTVTNPGTDWLSVTSISADHPAYIVVTPPFVLAAGDRRDVVVGFSPAGTGSFPATLTILSSDPDEPLLAVPLAGVAVEPPVIGVEPRALSHDLFTGDTATDYVTISNSGTNPLEFQVTAEKDNATDTSWHAPPVVQPREPAHGVSSHQPHASEPVRPVATEMLAGPRVLVIQDRSAWGVNMQAFIYNAFGIVAALINSQEIDTTDFGDFDLVLTTGDQTPEYYQALTSHRVKFEEYVSGGGVVQHQAATQGDDVTFAGGVTALHGSEEVYNLVTLPSHPIVKGLPLLLQGDYANHMHLVGLPLGAQVITTTHDSHEPTTVEYRFGAGHVIATGMTWEFLWSQGYAAGAMMVNAVKYALSLAGVPWLAIEPASGVVAPGASLPVAVHFDAAGLYGGAYRARVRVQSNDPITPEVHVSAELHVTGAPDIAVTDTLLDFGAQFVGVVRVDSLTIANAGAEILSVTGIQSDHPAYTPDAAGFDLAPGEYRVVHVTFAPEAVADMPALLTITSNDIDEGVTTVRLAGSGIAAPVIGAQPLSFEESLAVGESVTRALTITNTGGSALSFAITAEYLNTVAAGAGAAAATMLEASERSHDVTTAASVARARGQSYAGNRPASRAIPLEITPPGAAPAGGLAVLLLQSGGVNEIRSLLLGFPDIATVDVFNIDTGTPSLDVLRDYSAAIIINDIIPFDPDLLGDVLADYVDEGGGVIMTLASFIGGWDVRGRFQSGGYYPFTIGSGPVGSATLAQFDAGHPIMQGVTAATGDVLGATSVVPGAEDVARWSNGFPFVATRGARVVGLNVFLADGGYWDGDVPLILHNAVGWCSGRAWLSVDPESGIIPPDGDARIDVTMNTARMTGGDYRADVHIASNDPFHEVVLVPATLHVSGVPDIALADTLVDFGACVIGASRVDTLVVRNDGTDLLTVHDIASGHPVFTVDPAGFTVPAGEEVPVRVTFSPVATAPVAATLTITSDDPDEGVVYVSMAGSGLEPPVVGVEPDSIAVALATGQEKREDLRISNTGVNPLHYVVRREPSSPFAASAASVPDSSTVLVIQDAPAWGVDLATFIETQFNVGVTTIGSAQIDSVDFQGFHLVVTAGDQPANYYIRLSLAEDQFESFVLSGGVVQYNTATIGVSVSLAGTGVVLPGSAEPSNA
ncbi:MAG TPA: S8 family serine peptidase, partial [Candidatus Krumholzibacteria bacterium]